MGSKDLDRYDYDEHLTHASKRSRSARKELEQRHIERKSKGYTGWHFGLGNNPVKTSSKEDFKRELDKRGLMMRDDVKRTLK